MSALVIIFCIKISERIDKDFAPICHWWRSYFTLTSEEYISENKYLKISTFRCRIPQCDHAEVDLYIPDWLEFTTPFTKNKVPEKCLQYQFDGDNDFMQYVNHQCSRQYFNQSKVVPCHEFVYNTDSLTILNDVNL